MNTEQERQELKEIARQIEEKRIYVNHMFNKGYPYERIMRADAALQELNVRYARLSKEHL